MSRLRVVKHRLNVYRLRALSASTARDGAPVFAVRSERARNVVALSFDDGPSPDHTPLVLEVLSSHQARATFFLIGKRAEAYPELVAAVSRLHELGNHTHTHPHPSRLTDDQLRSEITQADQAIRAAGGVARFVRPPWGEHRTRMNRVGRELGLETIMWSVDSGDTTGASAPSIAANAGKARGGDILLFHDNGVSPGERLEALELTLGTLSSRGLGVVTVSELLARR